MKVEPLNQSEAVRATMSDYAETTLIRDKLNELIAAHNKLVASQQFCQCAECLTRRQIEGSLSAPPNTTMEKEEWKQCLKQSTGY